MSSQLTARALSTAAALLNAAAIGDNWEMRRILRALHEPGPSDQIGTILRAVAGAHHVEIGRILGDDRRRDVTRARQTVCYIAAHIYGHGYAPTGRAIDCDHTTVMHAVRKVSADPAWRMEAEEIAQRIGWDREAS